MQDSIGGVGNRPYLIVNLSPSMRHQEETHETLNFAKLTGGIKADVGIFSHNIDKAFNQHTKQQATKDFIMDNGGRDQYEKMRGDSSVFKEVEQYREKVGPQAFDHRYSWMRVRAYGQMTVAEISCL